MYLAAGSLAVLLVWLYWVTEILLFGAERTEAYTKRCGSLLMTKAHAEAVAADARPSKVS